MDNPVLRHRCSSSFAQGRRWLFMWITVRNAYLRGYKKQYRKIPLEKSIILLAYYNIILCIQNSRLLACCHLVTLDQCIIKILLETLENMWELVFI